MHITTIIFLGIATNLDNMCIGMSYGMAGRYIRVWHNIIIAAISGVCTSVICFLAGLLSHTNIHFAIVGGAALLIGMGAHTIIKSIREQEQSADGQYQVQELKGKEVILAGIVLALNCIPVALGAGLMDVSAFLLGASIALFSCICVLIGNFIGIKLKQICRSKWLDIASGVMLMVIGIWEILG